MDFYVYAYIDPTDYQVFYIGKGKDDRYLKHLYENYSNTENKKKYARIKSLKNKGLRPIIIKIVENLSETDAYSIEEKLIAFFGRKDLDEGGCLTNICLSNKPPDNTGKPLPEHLKTQLSITRKGEGNPMFGSIWDDERRAKAPDHSGSNNPFYGRSHSAESIEKMLESRKANGNWNIGWPKGQPRSEETKLKLSDTWLVTDPDGNQFDVTNLSEFAKGLGLHPETLRTAQYKKKGKTKCGWRAIKIN